MSAGVAVVGLVAAGSIIAATPAYAAPGDARALGAGALLTVNIPPIAIGVDTTVGAIAVTNPGTDSTDNADYTLADLALASITLQAVTTNATSDPTQSSASAAVTTADFRFLGLNLATVEAATAQATCTVGKPPQATADVVGLTVLGTAASVDVGADAVASVPLGEGVGGADLTGLTLSVTVSQQESVTGTTAAATALIITVSLEGTLAGVPYPRTLVGVVTLASAACETPAANPVTATGITPAVGPTAGGQAVTITGSGFTPDTTVSFGPNPATSVTVDPAGTSLTAVTPAGAAGPTTVTVTNAGGSATLDYTYVAPAIASISPTSGPETGGTTVTITGQGLDSTSGVTFGGVAAEIVSVSPDGTQVVVTTPPGTGVVDAAVTFAGGTTITASDAFTYVPATVTGLTPTSGPTTGGTTVTIDGSGLADATGVLFDGVAGTIVGSPSDTQIVVVTPPGAAGPVDVTVQLPDGDVVLDGAYVYVAAPTATTVDPDQGPASGGTAVVVNGSGFVPGETTVTICGTTIPATQVTVNQAGTSLRFSTPACSPQTTTIVVTTPGGATAPLAYRYVAAATGGGSTGNLANTGGISPAPALTTAGVLFVLGILAMIVGDYRRRRA